MTTQDTLTSAISYFQSQGYTFPMLIDADGQVAKDYQMHALPTSILIDPDGIVLEVTVGAGMNGGALRAKLDQIFAVGEGE
jgi:peroxiredoxin